MICEISGTLNNANAISDAEIVISNYARTTFHKTVRGQTFAVADSGNPEIIFRGFGWKSTAAVVSLLLTSGATAFANGTIATLYGRG